MTAFPGYRGVERFHHDKRHNIYRALRADGQRVVVKTAADEASTAHVCAGLRHEYEMLVGLDCSGVVRVDQLMPVEGNLALITLDAGEKNFACHLQDGLPSIPEFLDFAVQIAAAIAAVHAAGCIHRDLNPANIVFNSEQNLLTLIDFEFSTTRQMFDEGADSASAAVGSLAYIAPEQTGRIGRSADHRADLYSLGATLYEMLVGAPPFGVSDDSDPLALVHAHLAQTPASPSDRVPSVPRMLSELVLKLLAKAPEDRYQSADAVVADLVEARRRWSVATQIDAFPLAQGDIHTELRIPEKIYGRDEQARQLLDVFGRASTGLAELLLVTGAPGIGKSALVRLVHAPMAERRGVFIGGKFDQLQRSVPYSAVAEAFRELVHQVLAYDDKSVAKWRQQILDAVGDNGKILVELVPDMENLLGPQPPLLELGPDETANRFQAVLKAFVRAVAREEVPLVLFLDDLQWIDAASLRFVESILGNLDLRHLLVLGAYRDEEVSPAHPLAHALGSLGDKGVPIHVVHLETLATADITQLCADTFARPLPQVRALAELLARKTAGNPFFLRRMLRTLYVDSHIGFDRSTRSWRWDIAAITAANVTNNVLVLMEKTIVRLPPACQELLGLAACIGNRFDLRLLGQLSGQSQAAAVNAIFPALDEGLLLPVRDAYQAPRHEVVHEALDGAIVSEIVYFYRFAHDRVQQAAYDLTDECARREAHLQIGQALLVADEERLFDAVDHLNLAVDLITNDEQRMNLVELNLRAGVRAKTAGAYRAALDYLNASVGLMSAAACRDHAVLAFALDRERAEAAYLAGEHALANELIVHALANAPSPMERAKLFLLRISVGMCSGDVLQAVEWMRCGLAELGTAFPRTDFDAAATAAMDEAARLFAEYGLNSFAQMPLSDDSTHRLCSALYATGAPAAFVTGDGNLLALIQARLAIDAILYGHTEETPFALAAYAFVRALRTGDYATAYEIGSIGVTLARARPYVAVRCVTLHIFATHVNHWTEPLRSNVPLLREAIRYGAESGELKFAVFAHMCLVANLCELGYELSDLAIEADAAQAHAARTGNAPSGILIRAVRQFVLCMQGRTRSGSFDDDAFEENRFLEQSIAIYPTGVGYYWICRLSAAVIYGDASEAMHFSERAAPLLKSLSGFHVLVDHVFYTGLALTALHASSAEPVASLQRIRDAEAQLAVWASHCRENVEHRRALLAAEIARIEDDGLRAVKLYDQAIEGARLSGFIHDEALANELAAHFFLAQSARRIARMYMQSAVDAYARWGAIGKVQAIEAAHHDLLLEAASAYGTGAANSSMYLDSVVALDAISLVKASQAISGEIVMDRLLEKLMQVVIEAGGAERAALLIDKEGKLEVQAKGKVFGDRVEISLERTALQEHNEQNAQDALLSGAIQLAWRTNAPVVLVDAAKEGPFVRYIAARSRQIHSVLCVPVPRHGRTAGVMYLENNLTPHAFTRDRVEIVRHLASQLAISLENAQLVKEEHEKLERIVAERTAELQAANRELDDFAGAVSHDLRAPLRAMSGFSQALIEDFGEQFPDDARNYLDQIGVASGRMGKLIDGLLTLSRSTRVALNREVIDLSAMAQTILTELARVDPQRQVTSEIAPEIAVRGDPAMLESVMRNLLGNAWKYTVRTPDPVIRMLAQRQDGTDFICVSDNGAGFDMAHANRLFQPFQRLHRQDEFPGIGIGLATVQRIVLRHGGLIKANGKPGEGATFCFSLSPAGTASAAKKDAERGTS